MKSEIKKNLSIFNGFYEFRPIHDILVSPNELTNDDVSVINDTLDKIENIVKNLRNSMFTYEVNALAWFRETFENGIPGTEPEPPVLYKFTVPTNAKYTITPASGIIETVEGGDITASLAIVGDTDIFESVTVTGIVGGKIDFTTDPTKCTITGKMPGKNITAVVKVKVKPEPEPEA